MPGGDGTGPLGQGPMTGRSKGFCIFQTDERDSSVGSGFAGIHGIPVRMKLNNSNHNTRKEAVMPRGDGTGPAGMGPMTGRAAGFCAGNGMPGYTNPIPGRGFGMGFGRGRGFGGGGGRGWGRGWAQAGVPYGTPYAAMPSAAAPYGTPYAAAPTKKQELDMLQGQAEQFETALGDVRKRLQELETEKTTE